jgi:hypothetical protein
VIVAYAMGGGLGHLRRTRLLLSLLAPGEPCAILSATRFEFPNLRRVPRELAGSRAKFADWLRAELRSLEPSAILIDAFPLGILGELADHGVLPDVPVHHAARLLAWERYAAACPGAPRRFAATAALEPLAPAHEEFLRRHSDQFFYMDVPVHNPVLQADPLASFREAGRELWLVVHSGPRDEVAELLTLCDRHPQEKRVVAVTPFEVEGVSSLQYFPASELYPFADRIVTGCGFNTMRETEPYAAKHLFVPFARRFDDQHARAALRKRQVLA